ncbi:mucin-3B-like [Bombina bombina]|uniref:mucin-3B-like n=1 Tax=Bombina bombina TaxID=8345 RepID=UPI00235AC0DB|nr:mucin-3B-like [Bombina bombina]
MTVSGVMTCVSNCSSFNNHYIDCTKGRCSLTTGGPVCFCGSSEQFWYTGDRCQTHISKPGVYGGVSAAVFVLLGVVSFLAFLSYRRRKKGYKEKLIDNEKHWYEDGWEGDGVDNASIRNPDSSSHNGSHGFNSNQENFRPALDKVDTDIKMTISRPHLTQSYLN